MKLNSISRVAAMAILVITLFVSPLMVLAQGTINVMRLSQNYDGNTGTRLTTIAGNYDSGCPAALAPLTTYDFSFSLSMSTLESVERQNVVPFGPGAGTAYYAGPVAVSGNGNWLRISVGLNFPDAKTTSAVSIYGIVVNGVSLSRAVSANIANPSSTFDYLSPTPIESLRFRQSYWAESGPAESGFSVQIMSVPEPSSAALLGISLAALLIFRRRK